MSLRISACIFEEVKSTFRAQGVADIGSDTTGEQDDSPHPELRYSLSGPNCLRQICFD